MMLEPPTNAPIVPAINTCRGLISQADSIAFFSCYFFYSLANSASRLLLYVYT